MVNVYNYISTQIYTHTYNYIITSMKEFGGARGGSRGEILTFNQPNLEATCHGVKGDAGAGGAAADDENIKRIGLTGANQSRFLRVSGRHHRLRIVNLLPQRRQLRRDALIGIAGGHLLQKI